MLNNKQQEIYDKFFAANEINDITVISGAAGAITIHKSQGSEYDKVAVSLDFENNRGIILNGKKVGSEGLSLLYVACSRARKDLKLLN